LNWTQPWITLQRPDGLASIPNWAAIPQCERE
jgi:hypothetical protein